MSELITCLGLVLIAGLMAYGLHLGHDGVLLTSTVGLIAGAIGIHIDKEELKARIGID